MSEPVANEIRTLIRQNNDLEARLRELQVAIAGIRADFEAVMYARIRELDAVAVQEPQPPTESLPRETVLVG